MGQTRDSPPSDERAEGGDHAADHHEAQHDEDGLSELEPEPSHDDYPHPADTGAPHGRRQQISRGRRFWAALRRSPMDPVSQRPICFAFNRGLLEGAPTGGCPRGPDRCRFAHVPLDQVPGAEEAAAILALEAARTRTYRAAGGFEHGDGGAGGFDGFGMPLRRRMLPHSGKVMMPVDPETQQRICFFYNAMPTGCVNGDTCPFMHTKVDLRALGFQGPLPGDRESDVSAHTDAESMHQPYPTDPEAEPEGPEAASAAEAGAAGTAGAEEHYSPSRARPADHQRSGGAMPRSRSSHNLAGAGRARGGGYSGGMPYSPSASMPGAPEYWSPTHGHPPPAPPAPHHPSAHANAHAPPPPGTPHYPPHHYGHAPSPGPIGGDPFAVAAFAAATVMEMYRAGSPGMAVAPGPAPAALGGAWQAGGYVAGEYPVPHHYASPEPAPGYAVPAAPYGLPPGAAPAPGGYWPAHAAPPPMPPPPRRMRRHMTHPPRLQTGGGPMRAPPQPGGY